MPFTKATQVFPASINTMTIGAGDNTVTMGGENVMPLYTFDAEIEHRPLIGIEVSDLGYNEALPKMSEFYAGTNTLAERAAKAATAQGADFVALELEAGDPNDQDRSIDELVEEAKAVADAITCPLVVSGCRNIEKDEHLLGKIAEALPGKNVLYMSAREENYKGIGASVAMACSQMITCESAVDINLAKQLNVLVNQLGVSPEAIAMNIGTATVGYGFEYVASTMDRIRLAALDQNDTMLQMPIITPLGSETWNVKESIVSEEDFPEWGPTEQRGIQMEICTAAACLAGGSNAVTLRHPQSVATIAAMVSALM